MGRFRNLIFPMLRGGPAGAVALKVRYRVVVKYLGGSLIILGGAFLLTAAVSFMLAEKAGFLAFYVVIAAVSAAAGWVLYRMAPEKEINVLEAAAIASLSFLVASFTGAVPFVALAGMPALDAWFEAMSGFTTTGFSLLDVDTSPGSVLFLRALSQWFGGMGFVVLTVSFLVTTGSSAVTFLKEEIPEKVFPRIARHVQLIVITYVILTVLGIVMLAISGLGLYDAVCYTLSGVSTGGFAVHRNSIADLPYHFAAIPLIIIMITGSVSFILYYRSWKTNINFRAAAAAFFRNSQVILLLVFILVLGLLLSLGIEGPDRFIHGFILAASAQTTTGYYTIEPSSLPGFALVLVIGAMFIGGSMGSTSGGVKLFRIIQLFATLNRFIVKYLFPRETVLPGEVAGKGIAKEELPGIFYVIAIYGVFIFIGTVIFAAAGYDPLSSVFEVTSAVGTVGLSTGVVEPGLNQGLKLLLIFLMWVGRLEFLPLLIFIYSFLLRSKKV